MPGVAEIVEPVAASGSDPRPVVGTAAPNNLGILAFVAVLLLGGAWVFSLMSDLRQGAGSSASTMPQSAGARVISSSAPPPLPARLTNESDAAFERRYLPTAIVMPGQRTVPQNLAPRAGQPFDVPRQPQPAPVYDQPAPSYRDTLPQVAATRTDMPPAAEEKQEPAKASAERVRAGRLGSPSLTVPLGTIIPAVLETAIDSTRPGSVRALVQRDVRSFDGTGVLVPRGSRLYGGYEGELGAGQNRALITWTRLLRPDGVTIALDSQASDPLGRAGIKGKVDSKFLQRFGGAILQTILDIGVGIATREASNGVIVALPGSYQNVTRIAPTQITPTLRVRQGTSVSVYVARDLDFSSVDN